MNILKYILIGFICLSSVQDALSQYYLKTKSDSIALESDSVKLTTDEYRGLLNWQVSPDQNVWKDLSVMGDTLPIRIDSTSFFRAQVFDGTCDPIFSDSILIGERKIMVEEEFFMIDTLGGVYYLPNGVKLKVPSNAVDTPIYIAAYLIDSIVSYQEVPAETDILKDFLGNIYFNRYDITFNKPIKIVMPIKDVPTESLFLLNGYDIQMGLYCEYKNYFLVSLEDNFLEYKTDRLIPVRLEAVPYPSRLKNKNSGLNLQDPDDCRTKRIRVESLETDFETYFKPRVDSYNDLSSCSMPKINNKITFIDCGNIVEEFTLQEISSGCEPQIEVYLEDDILKVGGDMVTLAVRIHISDNPLANQLINISVSNSLMTSEISGFTDDDGIFMTSVIALSEDMDAFIECSSEVQYHRQKIVVTSPTSSFRSSTLPENRSLSKTNKVVCYDECTHYTELDCGELSTEKCNRVKATLYDYIEIKPQKLALKEEATFKYPVKAFNYLDEELSHQPKIQWTSTNPGVAYFVGENLFALEKGTTTIHADWCNAQEENYVKIADICDSVYYVIDTTKQKLFMGDELRIDARCEFKNSSEEYVPDIKWESSNIDVLTVDAGGYVKTIGLGLAEVKVSWCDTFVNIPFTVQTKIDQWIGQAELIYEDHCKTYYCDIYFNFTIYWDSLRVHNGYNSTGGIKGKATVYQKTIDKYDFCDWGFINYDNNTCDYGWESYRLKASVYSEITGAIWRDNMNAYIFFPGYYGYWEQSVCVRVDPVARRNFFARVEEHEEYYDIVPIAGEKLNFSDLNKIETILEYKFKYNLIGGQFIEYSNNFSVPAKFTLTRVYSNYDDI